MLTYSVGWASGRGCAGRDSTLPTGECRLRVRVAACRFPSTLSHSRGVERRTSTSGLLAQVLVGLTPGSERGEQGIERLRSSEGITLAVRDAERHQAFAYLLGFDEFGHRVQPEFMRDRHDGLDHRLGARTAEQVADEDPVDLDARDRQFLEVGERGEARSEVIECEAAAERRHA